MAVDISGFVPPKIVQQWFKPNGVSYLGEDMVMFGVCVHQTGNTSPGAEAQQNVDYMNSAECIQRQASWHATIGLHQIIETIPQTKQAFHASDGSGPGNTHFKAIEHVVCYPVGSAEYRQVMLNGAWYTAKSLRDAGLPCNADTVKQHHDFARDGKDCPMQFRDHGEWDTYTAYVKAFYDRNEWGGGAMPTQPPVGADPVTGKFIHQDFVVWFAAHGGVDVLGRPLTGAFIRDGLLVQYFERFVLERHPENKEPYRVLGRRLGAEALAREYPQGAPA